MSNMSQPEDVKNLTENVKPAGNDNAVDIQEEPKTLLQSGKAAVMGKLKEDMLFLEKIAQHPTLFLINPLFMKDEINRQESVRKARLRAQAKIDAEVKLQRRAYKDKWGIALDYSYRYKPTFHSKKTFYILLCLLLKPENVGIW